MYISKISLHSSTIRMFMFIWLARINTKIESKELLLFTAFFFVEAFYFAVTYLLKDSKDGERDGGSTAPPVREALPNQPPEPPKQQDTEE